MFLLKVLLNCMYIFIFIGVCISTSYGNEKQNFKVAVINALNNDLIKLNTFINEKNNSAEFI